MVYYFKKERSEERKKRCGKTGRENRKGKGRERGGALYSVIQPPLIYPSKDLHEVLGNEIRREMK